MDESEANKRVPSADAKRLAELLYEAIDTTKHLSEAQPHVGALEDHGAVMIDGEINLIAAAEYALRRFRSG